MLLASVIILCLSLVNAEIIDFEGRDVKGSLLPNNLTVTFEKVPETVTIQSTPSTSNIGDLIADNGKEENDTLLYTEIFINKRNLTTDEVYVMKVKETTAIITEIRLLNVGLSYIVSPTYSITRNGDKSSAEVKFFIKKEEVVRVWVEIYGKNGSALLTSSWVLISLSAVFYYVLNKQ